MSNKFILDTYSLLSYFEGNNFSKEVSKILKDSLEEKVDIYISEMTIGKIISLIKRNLGDKKVNLFLNSIKKLPVVRVIPDEDMIYSASIIQADYKDLNITKSFELALSKQLDIPIFTGEKSYKKFIDSFKIKIV